MQSDALVFVNSVVEGIKVLISWMPVIGGYLAFIIPLLAFIFREWIKDWFARVAHERRFAGDKAIESHRADETLRVQIINELFRRKLGAHDVIRKAAVELSDCMLDLLAIVRLQQNQNTESEAWRRNYEDKFNKIISSAREACLKFGTVYQSQRSEIGMEVQNACELFCITQTEIIDGGQTDSKYLEERQSNFTASWQRLEIALKDDLRRIYEGGFNVLLKLE